MLFKIAILHLILQACCLIYIAYCDYKIKKHQKQIDFYDKKIQETLEKMKEFQK